MTVGRVRFALEAAFIVVVAAVCWAAHLSWRGIVPAMAGAWLLVTLVERSAAMDHSKLQNGRYGFLFRRGRAPAAAESHVTVPETEPTAEHPPTPMPPEPEQPAPEPAPPVPEPEPPEPGEPVPQLHVVAEPEPEPEPEPDPVIAYLQPTDGAAHEWNVWDLERIARDIEGRDPARDRELAFLLVELRQFANADGRLAVTFDAVVRESFGELLFAPA